MRNKRLVALSALLAGLAGLVTLSWAQERPQDKKPLQAKAGKEAPRPAHDLARLPAFRRGLYLSARSATEWLQRSNRSDGLFRYVAVPALRKRRENDTYLSQAGATQALAGAARFFRDENAAALATQAVLTLLLDTAVDDTQKPPVREVTFRASERDRLAAAALLVLSIHDLPAPAADLRAQSEQLVNWISRHQQPDGSFGPREDAQTEAAQVSAGLALCALFRSQNERSPPAQRDRIHKSLTHYLARWRERKSMAPVPLYLAACAEAFHRTKEKPYAEAAFEMADWLGTLQYPQGGGFMSWADGKAVHTPPHIGSAGYAGALVEACRVARQAGDVTRFRNYQEAAERALFFVAGPGGLQYTSGNTQHYADWYREEVVGGFFAAHDDGNLRLEYTQHALNALVLYLRHVAGLE